MEQPPGVLEERAAPKVLLFSVDDALLALHLGWVEAVVPSRAAEVFRAAAPGLDQPFVLYRNEPAFVLEPRVLFGLARRDEANVPRAAHLVLRSGSHLLALRIDECVGVQEVDTASQLPIASALTGDGGVPVGHLLALDGRPVTVLDPSRLLDGAAREQLTRAAREARAFLEREREIARLWGEIAVAPSATSVRKYARLLKRNGRTRRARAAREVSKALADRPETVDGAAAEVDLAAASVASMIDALDRPAERRARA